ncbi:uncharacterized protein [Coffea arabica]|uniref:RNase H type-1 domain-containing protein n=1 Tax=Coffea arabica TaxID=13443 RepID=A0ABM4U5N3_COFAR
MTSLQAELKALTFGDRLAIASGYSNLHLESDSFTLVQIIQGKARCPWRSQGDLQDLLQVSRFVRRVSHCFREANRPADRLASVGADSGQTITYHSLRDLPSLVRGDVSLDQLGVPSLRRVRA